MKQRTDDWFKERLGHITASRMSDVLAKGRGNQESATRKTYMMQLLCERLTGQQQEAYSNEYMLRGTELEPVARSAYEIATENWVDDVGFIKHPNIEWFGASPDGLVGDCGLVEIKCPKTTTHIETVRTKKIDRKYQLQMTVQMLCTKRNWCDFVSFDDRLPAHLQLCIIRYNLEADIAAAVIEGAKIFLSELQKIQDELG